MTNVNSIRVLIAVLAAAALSLTAVTGVSAQESQVSLQARGGIAVPVGMDLYEAGPSFGGDLTYWVTEGWGLRAAGDFETLGGKAASELTGPEDVPDMDLLHFRGGLVYRALASGANADNPWRVDFDVLAGVSSVDISDLPTSFDLPPFEDTDFSETYFGATGGVTIGYRFSDNVGGFVSGQAYYVATDPEDFEPFGQFDPMNPEPETFTDVWTVPIRGGLTVYF